MFPWCEQARQLVGPGSLEHSRLWRRLATAASTSSRFPSTGDPTPAVWRRNDGSSVPALRRPGCAQEPALAKAGDTVVACVRHMATGSVEREVRTFKTTTKDLLALSDGLAEHGCTHVAMEATGVYWKPVWHILSDGDFVLVLANAAHVKNVPGRKTDVNDATWLADLLAHG